LSRTCVDMMLCMLSFMSQLVNATFLAQFIVATTALIISLLKFAKPPKKSTIYRYLSI